MAVHPDQSEGGAFLPGRIDDLDRRQPLIHGLAGGDPIEFHHQMMGMGHSHLGHRRLDILEVGHRLDPLHHLLAEHQGLAVHFHAGMAFLGVSGMRFLLGLSFNGMPFVVIHRHGGKRRGPE